jgi:hypothetical protein
MLARLLIWLFGWRDPMTHVSRQWLENHTYEGIREERMRQAER